MKKFNPDIELKRKKRKYTKKHLVYSLLGLIALTILGISFAYYEVNENSVLVDSNVVAPINITIMRGEQELNEIPPDGIYERTECVNNSSAIWNEETRKVKINFTQNDNCTIYLSLDHSFVYTGTAQEYVVPESGLYQIELWGASGGTATIDVSKTAGYGAYTSGIVNLEKNDKIYFYIGGIGKNVAKPGNVGGYNGGGYGGSLSTVYSYGGGGATDVRIVFGLWNNVESLRSRIMVSGAGGGSAENHPETAGTRGASGGGLIGYNGTASTIYAIPTGGTQVSGGVCNTSSYNGFFGYSNQIHNHPWGGGGGSGYYAGATGYGKGGGGGSSFISGHTGAVAITSQTDQTPKSGCTTGTTNNACSIHYSGMFFTDTIMIDGAGYAWTNTKGSRQQMPNPNGGYYDLGVGHTGNGYARITKIN